MATIQHGHPSYSSNYPVLWSDWPDPLYMYESPSFSSTKLIQIARYQLVHYVSGYTDSGGYRWFFCRVHRSGYHANSYWEVGWVPAVRLSDGRQVLKALGRYVSPEQDPLFGGNHRDIQMRPDTPTYDELGNYIGVASDFYDQEYYYYRCGDDDRYVCHLIINYGISSKTVPYPGQETTVKPWVVSGKNYWWLAGGVMHGEGGHAKFFESGITGGDLSPPYLKRWN